MPVHPGSGSLWLDLLGAEVRLREVAGSVTRSIEAGAGEPVVLIHGIFGHAETWSHNVMPLADGRRVYAIDMLGHGLSAKAEIDYSVERFADHVIAFMDAVGIEAAHLVGHSLGGWVAGWLAVHRPHRVASYVSVTGAGLQTTDELPKPVANPNSSVVAATRRAIIEPTTANVRETAQALMLDKSAVTDDFVETRLRIYRQPGFREVALRILDAFTGSNRAREMLTPSQLANIRCPTLLVWTPHNPAMPHEVAENASQLIPGGRYHLIDNAGHSPHVEQPKEFNQVVDGFLRSINGGSGLVKE